MPTSAKTRLLLAFGGASSEHEISIRSARSVLEAVDRERFEPVLLGIRRDGGFRTGPASADLGEVVEAGDVVTDVRGLSADLCFPVLHGPHGEDGTFQGFCEIVGLPYVGSGVLASALCMDKVAQKQLVDSAAPEVPLVPWLAMTAAELADADRLASRRGTIETQLGFPCFVKPANLGSSVGVVKVEAADTLEAALREAARYDARIIVERGVDAREIELAVLGNGGPETMVSRPGEIGLPQGVWYDYETKYLKDVATYHIPADVPRDLVARLQEYARTAFVACEVKGLARIDFLLDRRTGTPYLNELNTMPGFTSISMYPKLMEDSGVGYRELITRLCDLGLAHHAARRERSLER